MISKLIGGESELQVQNGWRNLAEDAESARVSSYGRAPVRKPECPGIGRDFFHSDLLKYC